MSSSGKRRKEEAKQSVRKILLFFYIFIFLFKGGRGNQSRFSLRRVLVDGEKLSAVSFDLNFPFHLFFLFHRRSWPKARSNCGNDKNLPLGWTQCLRMWEPLSCLKLVDHSELHCAVKEIVSRRLHVGVNFYLEEDQVYLWSFTPRPPSCVARTFLVDSWGAHPNTRKFTPTNLLVSGCSNWKVKSLP